MIVNSLTKWFQMNVFHPGIFPELAAIAVTYLLAVQIAKKLCQYFEEIIQKDEHPSKFELNPAWISTIVKYVSWLLLLWLCQVLFKRNGIPAEMFILPHTVALVLLAYRFTHWYIERVFWSWFVFIACLLIIALRLTGLWTPALHLLDNMSIPLGHVNLSLLDTLRTALTFVSLWSATVMVHRYLSFLLTTSTHMNYSDRKLIQGVIKFVLMIVVVMVTMASAGIHPAALAVTGGAAGFGIGVGLQKIGSNLVSGIALLIRKPINQGDVILLKKGSDISSYGQIKDIGLLYVHKVNRDGTEELVPNEFFITKNIITASRGKKRIRIKIPFNISYASDLHKAMALANEAGKTVDRVLTTPESECRLIEFGESSVELELRVWINDPQNGLANVKSSLLLEVWDLFHANDIEFSFPQRDLHIKSAVPLKISKDSPQPAE
jgi:small-conductance mechanosensitive channel